MVRKNPHQTPAPMDVNPFQGIIGRKHFLFTCRIRDLLECDLRTGQSYTIYQRQQSNCYSESKGGAETRKTFTGLSFPKNLRFQGGQENYHGRIWQSRYCL